MKYPELELGTIEAVVNKLGGMDGVHRFLSGELVVQVGDFFRETGEITIQIPALPRPTLAELKAKYSWIGHIESDTSPEGAVTLMLGTVLRPDEERIDGSEYKRRCSPLAGRLLGYQQVVWLVEHQHKFPEIMALLGKVYIDFPGLVVVDAGGGRGFPYLNKDGGRWRLIWGWVGSGLHSHGRVASK